MNQALILAAEHSETSKFVVGLAAILAAVAVIAYFGLRSK